MKKTIRGMIAALALALAAAGGHGAGNPACFARAGAEELPKETRVGFYLDTVITLTA